MLSSDGRLTLEPIADIRSGFCSRFGIPRQSGLAESARAEIVFRKAYQNPDYVRGLQDFSHIWVLWGFSLSGQSSPTVRPPRLGGNRRVGVFASRSPFRPNDLALSCVKLLNVEAGKGRSALRIAGADMLDTSPVYDIKPYVPADCHPEAEFSFSGMPETHLEVRDPDGVLDRLPAEMRAAFAELLALDPRPRYHADQERVYGMEYGGAEVHFTVTDDAVIVQDISL